MSTVLDKQIADAEKALSKLLRDVTPEVFARVQAWTTKMTAGAKLSEFLYDDKLPVADRVMVARSLIDILEAKDYERLPVAEKPAKRKAEPDEVSAESGKNGDEPESLPPSEEQRSIVRQEVRLQLAIVMERIAKALRDSK